MSVNISMGGHCTARQVASFPGANIYQTGAVPSGAVVSEYGAHLHKQATEDLQWPTVVAVPLNFHHRAAVSR